MRINFPFLHYSCYLYVQLYVQLPYLRSANDGTGYGARSVNFMTKWGSRSRRGTIGAEVYT